MCNGTQRMYIDLVRWTILTGMAYLPATVPPIGLGTSKLPIGMQVVGPYGVTYAPSGSPDTSPRNAAGIARRR